jgi:hypothetical protein
MAARNSTTRRRPADVQASLGKLLEGIVLVRVAQRSLDWQELASDEECALRSGLSLLDQAYNELEVTIGQGERREQKRA